MKNGAKIMITDLELRNTNRRLASDKAAISRNIIAFAGSLFILSLSTDSFVLAQVGMRSSNPLTGSFLYRNWNSGESHNKNLNQRGGSYALHHIFSPAVCTALPYFS
jgi:hypothetical protein